MVRLAAYELLSLCKYCLDREGIRSRSRREASQCTLCNGSLSNLEAISDEIIKKLSEYEFETFLIGASIPQLMLDKEDELRSKLKIKGRESLKSQITKMLSRNVSSSTGKEVDFSRPDLTVLLSLVDNAVSITPRSIWLKGKYRKLSRGIPQRDSVCTVCNGLGCAECNYVGKKSRSIQSMITYFLVEKFRAEKCNFVWLGSEDENSLVEGSGRPFYVEISQPKKRFLSRTRHKPFGKGINFKSDDIEIVNLEKIERRVTEVPLFDILCRVNLLRKDASIDLPEVSAEEIQARFTNAVINVRLSRKSRIVQRLVKSISVNPGKNSESLQLLIRCEGGIPLKKFVSGDGDDVEPNLSRLCSAYQINPQQPFDILEIKERKEKRREGRGGSTTGMAMSDDIIHE